MRKYLDLFGAKPNNAEIERYEQSANWNNGSFQNLEETTLSISPLDIPKLLYKQLFSAKDRAPKTPLAIVPFDQKYFLEESGKPKMIWYGHSVILMRLNSKTILIDPMFGPDAAPIAPVSTKRFSENTLDLIDELPEIDLVLMSHDHYDHLDYTSIQKLKHKVKMYYVALGVKRHLVKWGVDPHSIQEFDWWDQDSFSNIEISYTPTRHFSGRGLTDRAKSLWGGWAFKTSSENIWFSGDGGYGSHFKTVGERLGPFDFGFMECGQYNRLWKDIHMFPHQSIQAAIDANVKKAMPVHWAGFTLSDHNWSNPAIEFVKSAKETRLPISLPKLGQIFTYDQDLSSVKWWENQ